MRYKKRIWPLLLTLVCVMLIGISLSLYPIFSNWYSKQVQSTVHAEYSAALSNTNNEELQKAFETARKYNESLYYIQAANEKELPDYDSVLNLSGNGIMGYIEIPAIDVFLPIYHSVDESVLQKGAGHMPGTSLPIGGENTHTVIAAHSGMASAKMFTDLEKLKIGNPILIHILGKTLTYEVFETVTVLPSDVEHIQIEPQKNLLTLVTCVPFSINTHRLLVHATYSNNFTPHLDLKSLYSQDSNYFDL